MEPREDWGPGVSVERIDVAGIRTRVFRAGRGRPLLLLHGLGATAYSWRHAAREFATSRHVIVPDFPGFGRAEKPADFDYSIPGMHRWLVALMDQLGISSAEMAGNSMGGVIALWAALETPARVEKMALLGTPAYPENRPKLLWPLSWPLIGSLYEAALGEATVRWILKQTFVDPSVIDEDLVAEYSTPLASGAGRRAVAEFIRHAIPSDWQKRVAQYSLVKIPTLVLVGDHDRMVGVSGARRLAGDIPSSQLIVLDSCGHAPQEDAPGRVIAILKKFFGAEAAPLSR